MKTALIDATNKKTGEKRLWHFPVADERFTARCMTHDGTGLCVACGKEAEGVEPDARRYECDYCGEKRVYGLEELLMKGWVV